MKQRNPWAWVPTLYIAEGLPNVVVMTVAVVMYMQLGLTDTEIALYTGWLGLPWVIKPLWSPFVDLYRTKRWWVISMQLLLGSSLAGVGFTLNAPFWFQGSMAFFFLMAFSSATHDIAADGYYMLELDDHQQVWFVGIRNTFYRLAVIFGNGVLIPAAGMLQLMFRDQKAFTWSLVFYGMAALFIGIWLYHVYVMPHSAADRRHNTSAHEVATGIVTAFRTFFQKLPPKEMMYAMLFLLFYRFPEALLGKMSVTFLMRPASGVRTGQWHDWCHRLDVRRHPWRTAGRSRRFQALAVADGVCHHAARHRLCLHELCHARQPGAHQFVHLHRAVRLWFRLYRADALHAVFLEGRFPNVALCVLHGVLLPRPDASGHAVGMDEGPAGLQCFLHHGYVPLRHHVRRDSLYQG